MPTNLPPQYFEVEKKLKTAKTAEEKVSIMEELLSIIPKHKGTEKLQALYKTKIAKLRTQAQKSGAAAKHSLSYHIDKAGAGQVILIGPPNAGKSSLIKSLTNAKPEIGDYPFTTHTAAPAMMQYENIQIQLIDTPPITAEYFEFWQAEMIKNADAVLLMIDLASADPSWDLLALMEKLKEKRITVIPASQEFPEDPYTFHKKALLLANKIDLPRANQNLSALKESLEPGFEPILISTLQEESLQALGKEIYELLDILRVYSKSPGKKPSLEDPFIFKKGSTLMDMAKAVHKDFAVKLKFARIWGTGKYQGQKVNRDYVLQEADIMELHI